MSNKIGIFVHPFWMSYKGDIRLPRYKEILSSNKYEKLFMILPIMDSRTRRILFREYYHNFLIYFLELEQTLIPKDDIEEFKNEIGAMLIMSKEMSNVVKKIIMRYVKYKYGSLSRYDNLNCKKLFLFKALLQFKDEVVENIPDDVLANCFFGDNWKYENTVDYIDDLLATKTDTEIVPLFYGSVRATMVLASYDSTFGEIDETVDIFGEYINQCVIGISRFLKQAYNIKVNIISKDSLFYSESYNIGNFIKKNKNNKYLAVYNIPSPCLDEDGNTIEEDKYYITTKLN